MKIEVFTEPVQEEKTIRLQLKQDGDAVDLVAVDADGSIVATLISFSVRKYGVKNTLFRFISPQIGLLLDEEGKLKFNKI